MAFCDDTKHSSDPRFVVVDCPDVFYSNATSFGAGGRPKIAMGFQFSCFCKTVSWFRQALTVVPSARFVGKMEDDSVLHDARVVAELAFAHRLARREASSSSSSLPLLWYGHFAWAAFLSPTGTGHAKFCGDGDDLLLRSETRSLCGKSSLSGTVAPFASGGLDIRSRSLVEALSECAELWEFVKGFNPTNQSYGASCDGQQGYFVARCLQLPAASAVNGAASASAADSDVVVQLLADGATRASRRLFTSHGPNSIRLHAGTAHACTARSSIRTARAQSARPAYTTGPPMVIMTWQRRTAADPLRSCLPRGDGMWVAGYYHSASSSTASASHQIAPHLTCGGRPTINRSSSCTIVFTCTERTISTAMYCRAALRRRQQAQLVC